MLIRRQKKPNLEELIKDYSHFNETTSRVAVVNNNTLEKNLGGKSPFYAWGKTGRQDKEDNRSISDY